MNTLLMCRRHIIEL